MPLLRALSFRVGRGRHPDARRDPHPAHAHPRRRRHRGRRAGRASLVAWLTGEFTAVFRTIAPPLGVVLAAADDLRGRASSTTSGRCRRRPRPRARCWPAASSPSPAWPILFFRVPFVGLVALPPDLAPLITVLWVVGMANAVNLIDGLDGLAAGIVAIAAGAFLIFAEHLDNDGLDLSDDNIGALIAACVVGACLGFLPWNFHPAKIFMGDAGALLLGLLMAASTIAVGGNTDAEVRGQTFFFFAPLFIPLVILGVPILDTAWALSAPGQGPGGPDRSPTRTTSTTGSCARARPAPDGADPVGLDGAAVRRRARPRVHGRGRRVRPARRGRPGPGALHPVRTPAGTCPGRDANGRRRTAGGQTAAAASPEPRPPPPTAGRPPPVRLGPAPAGHSG